MVGKKRILVAPLNWGLGHSTRCIPIIKQLIAYDCEVIVGAEGNSYGLLKKEFPQLEFIKLEGVEIKYSEKLPFFVHFGIQILKFIKSIKKEHRALDELIKEYKINAVISDNRYGLYSSLIPNVIITHQLFVKTGFLESRVKKVIFKYIERFDHCWIPDYEGSNNLSGDLSHQKPIPHNVRFIGPLSRFSRNEKRAEKFKLLVILSGPEPNRSDLEDKILKQLQLLKKEALIVQGIVENGNNEIKINENIGVMGYLKSTELQKEINQAHLVICRSGYTSIMDLIATNSKALLIPTKGQAEQEYLATYLSTKGWFYSVKENKLDLERDIELALEKGIDYDPINDFFKDSLKEFVDRIN